MTTLPTPETSPPWSTPTRRTVALICLLLIALVVWRVNDALPIIIVALLLSYLLYPVATAIGRRLPGRGSHRAAGALLTFLLAIAGVALLFLLVVPPLASQAREFAVRLPDLIDRAQIGLEESLSQPIVINNQQIIPLESLREALGTRPEGEALGLQNVNLGDAARVFLSSLTGPAFSVLGRAFTILVNVLFLVTMMFYLIKDGGDFVANIVGLTPPSYRGDIARLFRELGKVWNAYLRGQILLSLAMGILTFIAAAILGLPNALVLGLLSAMFEFIPNLGPLLALIPAALLALATPSSTLPFLEGPAFALTVVVIWVLLQNLESIFLVPRIMGQNLNLHPIIVIIGVIAGASLAGPLGVILAAPTLSSLRVIGGYIYGKLTDREPFPPEDLVDPPAPSLFGRMRGGWRRLTGGSQTTVQ